MKKVAVPMKAWPSLLFIFAADGLGQSPAAPSFGFTPSAPSGVRFPNAVAVGDFNGDGSLDIVAVGTAINVILGDSRGSSSITSSACEDYHNNFIANCTCRG